VKVIYLRYVYLQRAETMSAGPRMSLPPYRKLERATLTMALTAVLCGFALVADGLWPDLFSFYLQ
jgi:hypothetical protein